MSSKKEESRSLNIRVTENLKTLWQEYTVYAKNEFYMDLNEVHTPEELKRFLVNKDYGHLLNENLTVNDKQIIAEQFEKDCVELMDKVNREIRKARKNAFKRGKNARMKFLQDIRNCVIEMKETQGFKNWVHVHKKRERAEILEIIKE